MQRLQDGLVVEISEDVGVIEEVGFSGSQFEELALIRCFQDENIWFHCGLLPFDFQHVAEHGAAPRHAFHNPNEHYTETHTHTKNA